MSIIIAVFLRVFVVSSIIKIPSGSIESAEYVRYLSSLDSGFNNMAEVEFYSV